MKIVVFGTGKFYHEKKEELAGQEIVAFLDNNSKIWGTTLDGVTIHNPADVVDMSYDAIVLMSIYAYEMRKQLMDVGVEREKIFYFRCFWGYARRGNIEYYCLDKSASGEVAILTTDMNYNGGSLAVIQMAEVFRKQNISVTIVCPKVNVVFLEEMLSKGYKFIIYPNLRYADYNELLFLADYKTIIANTLWLLQTTVNIAKYREIALWLHEPEEYQLDMKRELEHLREEEIAKINVYAVSGVCSDNFKKLYPNVSVSILPLGIKDMVFTKESVKVNDKIIFAIVGAVIQLKSQDILVKAIRMLPDKQRRKTEFWVIGELKESEYANAVKRLAYGQSNIRFWGQKSRTEMEELLPQIDVIVCASTEETLSIAIVEGMMYQKICITTDTTGIAEYIKDGENGFICESQNVEQLSQKMSWIIEHIAELDDVRMAARKTYVEHFSLEAMEKRIKDILV